MRVLFSIVLIISDINVTVPLRHGDVRYVGYCRRLTARSEIVEAGRCGLSSRVCRVVK
jgi:hypothetical protein